MFKVYGDGAQNVLGEKVSYVDYILFEELDLAVTSNPKNLDTVPLLKGFYSRFQQRPNLKVGPRSLSLLSPFQFQEYLAQRTAEKPKFHGNLLI